MRYRHVLKRTEACDAQTMPQAHTYLYIIQVDTVCCCYLAKAALKVHTVENLTALAAASHGFSCFSPQTMPEARGLADGVNRKRALRNADIPLAPPQILSGFLK